MLRILMIVLGVLFVGGLIFLSVWDIPAPSTKVEKTLSYDPNQL